VVDVAYIITMILSLTFLTITSMTEPGIIPREPDPLVDILQNVPYAYKQMILKQEGKHKFFISKKHLLKNLFQKGYQQRSIEVGDIEKEGGSSYENNLKVPSIDLDNNENECKIDKLSVMYNKSNKSV
jgi:hypothetical protein